MGLRGFVSLGLIMLAGVAAVPAVAWADADEASVHIHAVAGVARLADADAVEEDVATAPLGGLAARVGYATRDWFQYDASLAIAATGAASFADGMFAPPGAPPVSGPFETSAQLARVDAGVTLRLGVRYIPTLRLSIGAEGRRVTAPTVMVGPGVERDDARDASFGIDLFGAASVGFDVRLSRRTIVGVSIGGSYAVPIGGDAFQTVEGTVHWAHYWYPRW